MWSEILMAVILSANGHAQDTHLNLLAGPLIGIRIGHPPTRQVLGIEGGVGVGPERINIGFERRDTKSFTYLAISPWLFVGGSFGAVIDSDGKFQPLLGVWEGIPLGLFDVYRGEKDCHGLTSQVTITFGYRYTGVHELYITPKAGVMDGGICPWGEY